MWMTISTDEEDFKKKSKLEIENARELNVKWMSWPLLVVIGQALTSVNPISSLSSILGIVILPWET